MKFEQGQTYNTLKTLGVASKDGGYLQISQRIDQNGGSNITPDEKLTFVGRTDGKLWFTREDGTRVVGHGSHFDVNNAYNRSPAVGEAVTKLVAAKTKVAKAETDLVEVVEHMATLANELNPVVTSEVEETSSEESTQTPIDEDDRDEAARLFAEYSASELE